SMLPCLSCAMLPIQRYRAVSGAYVLCCTITGDVFGFRISYHRTPDWLLVERFCTEWSTSSVSYVGKLRDDSRYIRRSASVSSCWVVDGCGTHAPPPHAWRYAATVR